jgi:hypothetical protein
VKDSPEALLRFGSLIEDLECYVDNSLRRTEDGVIVGRRSGIKGWLQMEIPALYLKYSTVMAYKAAAKRMRQILEISDPVPLSAVLDSSRPMVMEKSSVTGEIQDYGADEIKCKEGLKDGAECMGKICGEILDMTENDGGRAMECGDSKDIRFVKSAVHKDMDMAEGGKIGIWGIGEVESLRARALYLEVIKPIGEGRRRQTALLDRLQALTDPGRVDDANMLEKWREKYRVKITVRTKSMWRMRLDKRKIG